MLVVANIVTFYFIEFNRCEEKPKKFYRSIAAIPLHKYTIVVMTHTFNYWHNVVEKDKQYSDTIHTRITTEEVKAFSIAKPS